MILLALKTALLLRFALQSRHRIPDILSQLGRIIITRGGERPQIGVASDAWQTRPRPVSSMIWWYDYKHVKHVQTTLSWQFASPHLNTGNWSSVKTQEGALIIQSKGLLWTMEGAFFYAVSEFNRSTKTCAIPPKTLPPKELQTWSCLQHLSSSAIPPRYGYDSMGSNGIYWDLILKHLHFKSGAKGTLRNLRLETFLQGDTVLVSSRPMQSSSPLLFLMWTGCPACIMIAHWYPKLPPQLVHAQIFSLNLLRTPALSAPRILLLDWIMKTHIWHVCPRLGWENLKETPRRGKKLKKNDCKP